MTLILTRGSSRRFGGIGSSGGSGGGSSPSLPSSGDPSILIDTRTSWASDSDVTTALGRLRYTGDGIDNTGARTPDSPNNRGFSWSNNYDGTGRRALVINRDAAGIGQEPAVRVLHSLPNVTHFYHAWYEYRGLHAYDNANNANRGNGSVGVWAYYLNGNNSNKDVLYGRTGQAGNVGRTYWTLTRTNPQKISVNCDARISNGAGVAYQDSLRDWAPGSFLATRQLLIRELKVSSGVGVLDGIARMWVDGTLVFERTDCDWSDSPFNSVNWGDPAYDDPTIADARYIDGYLIWTGT